MGKGGGGGGGAPQAHSVPQLGTIMGSTQTLAGYTAQLLQPLQSMFNWASDIATGGNVNPATASWPYSNVLGAGPNAQGYSIFTGLNTPGGSTFGGLTPGPWGAGGQNTYQSAQFGPGGQLLGWAGQPSATASPGGMLLSSGGGGVPSTMSASPSTWQGGGMQQPQSVMFNNQPSFLGQPVTAPSTSRQAGQMVTPVYDATTQKLVGFQDSSGKPVPGGVPGAVVPLSYPWSSGGGGGGQAAQGGSQPAGAGGGPTSLLGPFLSQAWSSIGDELRSTQMIPGLMQQTQALTNQALTNAQDTTLSTEGAQLFGQGQDIYAQGQNLYGQGQDLYGMATTGSGLFPSQQAFVDQGVQAQKAALAQQLASEGLGSSTQLAQLQGQADQAGAATAGQLIQGNLAAAQQQFGLGLQAETGGASVQGSAASIQSVQQQLNQGWTKIALGGQELSLGEQTAMTQELAGISSQSSGLQQQMWTQAMQGMGMLGQMIGTALSAFGYETQAASVQANLNIANAQIAAQAQQASQQSSGSGFSSLLGGLGSMLGGSGGLGGLFGGAGAAGAAASGVSAAGEAAGAVVVAAAV